MIPIRAAPAGDKIQVQDRECRTCHHVFYERDHAVCRRFPPGLYEDRDQWGASRFPEVQDHDRCGEWTPGTGP